jgi:hypothetical protein
MPKSGFARWSDAALERHLAKHLKHYEARRLLHNRCIERCRRMTDAELRAAAGNRAAERLARAASLVADARERSRINRLSDDDLWREATSATATEFHASVWSGREASKRRKAARAANKVAAQQRKQQINAARERFRHMTIDQLMAWQRPEHATSIELTAASEELLRRALEIRKRVFELNRQSGLDIMRDVTSNPRRITSAV